MSSLINTGFHPQCFESLRGFEMKLTDRQGKVAAISLNSRLVASVGQTC